MLNLAVSHRNTSLTSLLLSHSADFEVRNEREETTPIGPFVKVSTSIVSLLLDAGQIPTRKSLDGGKRCLSSRQQRQQFLALALVEGVQTGQQHQSKWRYCSLSIRLSRRQFDSVTVNRGRSRPRSQEFERRHRACFGQSGIIGLR